MLEEYEDRVEYAKTKHLRMLERFHVGDIVHVLFSPQLLNWGTVVEIDIPCRKVYVDLNGVCRQFDPEWLIHTNPEMRTNNQLKGSTKERTSGINKRNIYEMIARVAKEEKSVDILELDKKEEILSYFKNIAKKYTGKDLSSKEKSRKKRLLSFYKELQNRGFFVEVRMTNNNEFKETKDVTNDFYITYQNNSGKSIILNGKAILSSLRSFEDKEDKFYDFFVIFI